MGGCVAQPRKQKSQKKLPSIICQLSHNPSHHSIASNFMIGQQMQQNQPRANSSIGNKVLFKDGQNLSINEQIQQILRNKAIAEVLKDQFQLDKIESIQRENYEKLEQIVDFLLKDSQEYFEDILIDEIINLSIVLIKKIIAQKIRLFGKDSVEVQENHLQLAKIYEGTGQINIAIKHLLMITNIRRKESCQQEKIANQLEILFTKNQNNFYSRGIDSLSTFNSFSNLNHINTNNQNTINTCQMNSNLNNTLSINNNNSNNNNNNINLQNPLHTSNSKQASSENLRTKNIRSQSVSLNRDQHLKSPVDVKSLNKRLHEKICCLCYNNNSISICDYNNVFHNNNINDNNDTNNNNTIKMHLSDHKEEFRQQKQYSSLNNGSVIQKQKKLFCLQQCRHYFHFSCFLMSIKDKLECPKCQAPLKIQNQKSRDILV